MRPSTLAIRITVVAALAIAASAKPLESRWTFDADAPGKPPSGWSFVQTNPSSVAPVWQVKDDPSAPSSPHVLALVETKSEKRTFNLAVALAPSFKDLDVRVRMRRLDGAIDQGGGLIWRYKDPGNYYVCRYNPLENNLRLYCVRESQRTQIASADVSVEAGAWHEIRVRMIGDSITCQLDGMKLLEAKDATFPEAGKIGLWTKADASTEFDDLVAVLPEQ